MTNADRPFAVIIVVLVLLAIAAFVAGWVWTGVILIGLAVALYWWVAEVNDRISQNRGGWH